ncbi:hypothetical protein UXP46_00645 [Enterobacter ludwigii]|uniref:hypothetical protein n=1 Tax=Enterobacter ludwigii TaxID=299767 RepID=UPI002FD1D122
MANLIVTDNSYLELALKQLCFNCNAQSDLLIIDLDSFHSLNDMMDLIRARNVNDDVRVCLLGACSVIFKVLIRYKPIRVNEGFNSFKYKITNSRFSTLLEIKLYIESICKMSMFSNRQQQCLYALKTYREVNGISKATGLAVKTVYTIIRCAGEKINLTSLLQVRQFVSSNYSVLNER